jgi:type 1 glutamine amidotransferase
LAWGLHSHGIDLNKEGIMRLTKKELREAIESGNGILCLHEHDWEYYDDCPEYVKDMINDLEEEGYEL